MLKNLKKVISTIAAVAILATSASAFAVTFPDVDEAASYASSVELLTALGIVDGDDNGKFNPDNTVTRAEFAKMVVEALGKGDAAATSSYTRFADAQGHWAAGYIEAGVAAEFINGYDENTFGPDDTVTYAQAVKMLVGAAGYEAWAQAAGGWTAGYMSYGSSLGIIKGITGVTNDTALTRAQCAVLIANATKAPLLTIDGYQPLLSANGQIVQYPNYVQADGWGDGNYVDADGDLYTQRAWKTMLTEYHNAYEVMGRVDATGKTDPDTLEADEVRYTVEDSRNIDGDYVKAGTWTTNSNDIAFNDTGKAKVGTTNAADLMHEYTAAVIVKDDDTKEYTIVSIEVYGQTKSLELAAKEVEGVGEKNNKPAINVYKSDMTDDVKQYLVESDAKIYVNGYDAGTLAVPKIDIAEYVGDKNQFGTITLLDQTKNASTATNGIYDVILIDKTVSVVYAYGETRSTGNVITMQDANKLTYDPEDEDTHVAFYMDGEEIAFEDLQENDVLTIVTDPDHLGKKLLKDLTTATITVTRETVSGTVTRLDDEDKVVVIDGVEYEYALDSDPAVSKEYTFAVDANGVLVYSKELASNVNYGLVVKVYDTEERGLMMQIITADGEKVTYPVYKKNGDYQLTYKMAGTTKTFTEGWNFKEYIIDVDDATVEDAYIAYELSSGKIRPITDPDDDAVVVRGDDSFIYNASTSKLGGYKIDDAATKIIDISAFLGNSDEDAVAMTADMFVDDFDYKAVIIGKNSDNVSNFVVVTDGTANVRPISDLAIVKADLGTSVVDDEKVTEYTIIKNGEETSIYVSIDDDSKVLNEGDIIQIPVTTKAYVLESNIVEVFNAGAYADYEEMMIAALAGNLTVDGIDNTDDLNAKIKVEKKAGVVYSANLNDLALITSKDYTTDTNTEIKDLTITGANVYTYDFAKKANKGYRVEAAATSMASASFKSILSADENTIDWGDAAKNAIQEEVCAPIVIVREIDGDVTDVFYYIGEWTTQPTTDDAGEGDAE